MTLAASHSAGSLPVCNDVSKMTLMIGAISSLGYLSKRGFSLSGPAALPGLRFFITFSSPLSEMSISGIVVEGLCHESGLVSEGSPLERFRSCTRIWGRLESDEGDLGVKTELIFGVGVFFEWESFSDCAFS